MKKKYLRNIIHSMLALGFVSLIASCSKDDDLNGMAINSVTVNKSNVYIEDKIILNIDGTGYVNANLYSINSGTPLKFAKVAPTTFEITSTTSAPRALVFAQLTNSTGRTEKSLEVNFFIHGVDAFIHAEGIKPNDPSTKVVELLGAPANKTTSTANPLFESWDYPSKGISVGIYKNTTGDLVVSSVNLLSSSFSTTMPDGSKVVFTNYLGDLGNGWKINNTNTKMEAIIAKLGTPTLKASDPNDPTSLLRTYTFSNKARFTFYGATVDDYVGKLVQSCSL